MGRRLRACLLSCAWLLSLAAHAAAPAGGPPDYPAVTPGHALRFPHDHGAHPAFRTEWWYITG